MSTLSVGVRCVVLYLVQIISLSLLAVLAAQAADSNGANYNGALVGAFSVSPMGAATYSIPLDVPPGIGGIAPQLSLNYSSHSGNGLLGVGWSFGGLSAITRCPATLAQGGLNDPVDFDSNDQFCLDGQRLISVTNTSCSGGTEYRTEIDTGARICSYGTAGTGPAWFKVWTKAGQMMEYANTTNSRIEAQGRSDVLVWALNKISDSVGNYLELSYFEDSANGEFYVTGIDYTGNTAQGLLPGNSVDFIYGSRSDTSTGYIAGAAIRNSVRLTDVQISVGAQVIRNYALSYQTGSTTGRSQLKEIEQCAGTGASAECLPVTALIWSVGAASFNAAVSTGNVNRGVNVSLDVNGDGKQDLADCVNEMGPWQGPEAWHILIGTGSGFNTAIDTGIQCYMSNHALPIDYNADGKMDLLVPYANSRWYVLLSTGSGFTLVDTGIANSGYDSMPVVMDINGDGRDDLALAYSGYWYIRINNGNGFNAAVATGIASTNWAYRQEIDYDGDGMGDLLVPYANNRWYVLRSTGTTFQLVDTGIANTGYDKYPQIMDVDGDGQQDLVVNGSTKKLIYTNRGNGFSATVSTVGIQWASSTRQLDYNGDGRMDLIMPGSPSSTLKSTWHVLQSTGTGFSTINTGIVTTSYSDGYEARDFNGDGFIDLVVQMMAASQASQLLLHTTGIPDQLTSITDGSDSQIGITYKALTDSSVYSLGSSATYPQQRIQAPVYVVSRTVADNGVGGTNAQAYTYDDARVDLQGRGFLGFSTVTVTDEQKQIATATSYLQSFPYTGQIGSVSTSSLVGAGSRLSYLSNTWGNTQPYTNVYQVHLSSSTQQTYELNGTLASTVITNNQQYDTNDNPLSIVVTSTGGNATYSKTTVNTYDNDVTQWYIGRLRTATVTSTSPTGAQTRNSAFEYSPTSGLLTAEIIEPSNPQLILRTEYTYDGFGNKTSIKVMDSGGNSYPIVSVKSTTPYPAAA